MTDRTTNRWARSLYGLHSLASLAYEIVWIKILTAHLGLTLASMGTVLACFMSGLAIGSYLMARWARVRELRVRPIFLVLEFFLAAWTVALPFFLTVTGKWYLAMAPPLETLAHHAVRFGIASLLLLPPAILVGMVFPLLDELAERTSHRKVGQGTGALFRDGLIWSAAGSLILPIALIPQMGFVRSLWVLGGVSALAGVLGLLVIPAHLPHTRTSHPLSHRATPPFRFLSFISFAIGFCLFSFQIIGAKFLWLIVDATVYAEGILVGAVLILMAAGVMLYFRFRKRHVTPRSLIISGWVLVAITTTGWILFPSEISVLFKYIMDQYPWVKSSGFWFFVNNGILVLLVLGGPAIAAGLIFPAVCEMGAAEREHVADPIGRLTAFHYFGAVVGALTTTFILIPTVGMTITLAILGAAAALSGCILAIKKADEKQKETIGAVAMAAVGFFIFIGIYGDATFKKDAAGSARRVVYQHEDGTGVIEVIENRITGIRQLYSNRLFLEGQDSETDQVVARMRGTLPVILHPAPKSILWIGLGTGMTLSAALRPDVQQAVCVEPSAGVLRAAEYFESVNMNVLNDSRVTWVHQDPRNYVRLSDDKYDLVIQDLFFPYRPGMGALLTVEHYRDIRDRLASGGAAAQWIHLGRVGLDEMKTVVRTFLDVFPHATFWLVENQLLMIGPKEPLVWAPHLMTRRFNGTPMDGFNLNELMASYVGGGELWFRWASGGQVNRADFPVVELSNPSFFTNQNTPALIQNNLEEILATARGSDEFFLERWPLDPSALGLIFRSARAYWSSRVFDLAGNLENALKKSEEAVRWDPNNFFPRTYLSYFLTHRARSEQMQENWESARNFINEALRIYPKNREALFLLGESFFRDKNFDEATKIFQFLIQKHPRFHRARMRYGELLLAEKKFQEAATEFQAILDQDPYFKPARMRMAETIYQIRGEVPDGYLGF